MPKCAWIMECIGEFSWLTFEHIWNAHDCSIGSENSQFIVLGLGNYMH